MIRYKEFEASSLFIVRGNPQLNKDSFIFNEKGEYPYFTRTVLNNGILGYVDYLDEDHKIKGNSIAVGMLGMQFFYMPHDFYAGQFTKTVFPKFKRFNYKIGLYFSTLFNKNSKKLLSVLVRDFEKEFYKIKLNLPVNSNDEIDFDYIEDFISKLELERMNQLSFYLKTNNLDSNPSIANKPIEKVEFKEFLLGGEEGIFEIKSPPKRFNANAVKLLKEKEEGAFRYIVRTSQNNGQRGYIKEDTKYLSPGNSIAFGQDTATVFYQSEPYFTGDKIKIMTLKHHDLDEKIALYLLTVIRKTFVTFSWGQTSFNEKVLKSMTINLPVDNDGNINYQYMKDFIDFQQKNVAIDVIKWKNSFKEKNMV